MAPIGAPARSIGTPNDRAHVDSEPAHVTWPGSARLHRGPARPRALEDRTGRTLWSRADRSRKRALYVLGLESVDSRGQRSQMQHIAIEQRNRAPSASQNAAPVRRSARTPAAHRRRGRHHLQHVDGRGLLFDPFAVFAVARASAAVRSCNSRYVSALPMAITACSAKVCSSATWAVGRIRPARAGPASIDAYRRDPSHATSEPDN